VTFRFRTEDWCMMVRFVKTVPRSWCISFFPNVHSCIYRNDHRVEKRILNRVWTLHFFWNCGSRFHSPVQTFMSPGSWIWFIFVACHSRSIVWSGLRILDSWLETGVWVRFFKTPISPWRKRYFVMYSVMKVA
jgi:hypothetical protein